MEGQSHFLNEVEVFASMTVEVKLTRILTTENVIFLVPFFSMNVNLLFFSMHLHNLDFIHNN